MNRSVRLAAALALFGGGYLAGTQGSAPEASAAPAVHEDRVFEIRTYTSPPGKLNDLHARFRDHTVGLLTKHGMRHIGYWVPTDAPAAENTLVYILAHPSREAAKKSWDSFRVDPEWKKVQAASEANGKIVSKVEAVFVKATDYSPIQ